MEQPTNSSKESLKPEEATYEIDKDLKVNVLWFYQHKKREGEVVPVEEEENPNVWNNFYGYVVNCCLYWYE